MGWPRFEATSNPFGKTNPIRVPGGEATPWVLQECETRLVTPDSLQEFAKDHARWKSLVTSLKRKKWRKGEKEN
ncbi:UNVERIFIED_CONTAM: hypothetical protein PYX00_004070 [Menopon gallinae]|uniref:Uncharacterized protein n=1 Tax=Menopon gallinae TaxID=328185 RepID=A0AAW2I362_9NEOP